jgi:gliding motility-associated-like protein
MYNPAMMRLNICMAMSLCTLANKPLIGQCNQIYDWTTWNSFSPVQANGTIFTNGQNIGVTMSANYQFGSTPGIYGFGAFNSFNGSLPPNSLVPSTTWAVGPGGTTTMCFSQTVSNPVLLLASIGNAGNAVTLRFSLPYLPVFTGQQVTFVNDTTLIGREGYTIIMFPGNFNCVTIFSTTPEFYTNITWGLNPPLFPISISGDNSGCQSVTLTAEGGTTYNWSGGTNPNSATNVFLESGVYFITVTDDNDCAVVSSVSVDILEAVTSEISATICQGASFDGYASGGTFSDVFTLPSGCDSTRILNLTVLPSPVSTVNITICQGSSYAGYVSGGTFTDVFTLPSGCDSTRILNLTVLPSPISTLDITICQGSSYAGYASGGTYTDVFTLPSGCDSTRILNLTVLPSSMSTVDIAICQGSSYAGYAFGGTYTDVFTMPSGCDSTRILNLTVLPSPMSTVDIAICQGSSYAGYASGGTYTDVFTMPSGCDSTRILNLTVLPSPMSTVDTTICQGSSYAGYSSGGTYTDVFTMPSGCDSTRLLILNIQQPYIRRQSTTLCPGGQYDFNGRIITDAGIYTDTLQSHAGCDSILVLEVTVVAPFEFLGADTVVCQASSFALRSPSERTRWFDGEISNVKTVSRSGEYQAFIMDNSGCEIPDTINVQFNLNMYVPNAFSPNDDGINDCFQPLFSEMDGIKSYRLSIFDRWGNHIFSTLDPRACWNGETQENAFTPGVYGYYLEMSTSLCGPTLLKGDLTLVR